jgi:hypothetical protein
MPPSADELTQITLEILSASLERSEDESCYQIRFRLEALDTYDVLVKGMTPDSCAFKLDSYLIWTENAPLITIDAYMIERSGSRMFYRETSWGGWAVIGEAKVIEEENKDPMEGVKGLVKQMVKDGMSI